MKVLRQAPHGPEPGTSRAGRRISVSQAARQVADTRSAIAGNDLDTGAVGVVERLNCQRAAACVLDSIGAQLAGHDGSPLGVFLVEAGRKGGVACMTASLRDAGRIGGRQ